MLRNHIRFWLNDRLIKKQHVQAEDTLLEFIRLEARLTGSKEGCAEGDCGACTVLIGRLEKNQLRYSSAVACITPLAAVDGAHVVTIEHLQETDGALHPVQQAMLEAHGSQCGFCTPGIVMSLYALWMENPSPSHLDIERALQGNLCRCTGYAPILRAAQSMRRLPDKLDQERTKMTRMLESWEQEVGTALTTGIFIPTSVDELADILLANPDATIVAGATDVGLWITKHLRRITPAVFIGQLEELKRASVSGDSLILGAGLTYAELIDILPTHLPDLADDLLWRIGGMQVRNMGTLGGNIANGSPIGDLPPVLIALGATLTLRRGFERREILLEAFFIEYGQQDLQPGEFIESVTIPSLPPDARLLIVKISKRRDEDISAVLGAFMLRIADGHILNARVAFGGMAGTPMRARAMEAALEGQAWSEETLRSASAQLPQDFTPLSDWRASAKYRMKVAQNLLLRAYLQEQTAGRATS